MKILALLLAMAIVLGSICGLLMYSPNDEANSFEKEYITDCAYGDCFA